jgi:hypothetical protein
MRFLLAIVVLLPVLAGCGGVYNREPMDASPEEVQRALYSGGNPYYISLYTVMRTDGDSSAHSALLINASHRALFDPAGSWFNRAAPRRGDMHYGMTPRLLELYENYHARETHYLIVQTIQVSPEIAEAAMRAAEAQGLVSGSYCAQATSGVLRSLPGFGDIRQSWFPNSVMEQLEGRPGVTTRRIYRDNPADNRALLAAQP